MSSVFSNIKPRGSVARNGFDLSRRSVFSTKCGTITPVFLQMTVPDSEYQIDLKQLLRTQPLQTAAFTGFSINYDFFFVPNNYGYSSFNEFISQRKDERHVGQPAHTRVPTFDFGGFLRALIPVAVHDYLVCKMYPSKYYAYPQEEPTVIETNSRPHLIYVSRNIPWSSIVLDVFRAFDMFGYGNYLPYIKRTAELLEREMSCLSIDLTNYRGFRAAIYYLCHNQTMTADYSSEVDFLADLYGAVNNSQVANNENILLNTPVQLYPTLWPFLSYNKAFYEFYRNVYYDESFNIRLWYNPGSAIQHFDYVQLFNFDDWDARYNQSDQFQYNSQEVFRLLAMFVPKCHQYKKDLFTGVLPSTQFGDVSMMVTDNDWTRLYVKTASGLSSTNVLRATNTSLENEVMISSEGSSNSQSAQFRFDPSLAISVLESRRADAMQRFKERMLRAGNKTKDVFKAHGWSEPYSSSEAMPIFLGSFDGRLDINTVAATTVADNQELGQLGANGTAVVSGKKLHFKCHDFGYIVGVMYIVKDVEYDAYGVERQLCLVDPFDYPYPELQNISLFPVDSIELNIFSRWPNVGGTLPKPILGYLPRYMELKTANDKVHGEFYSAPFDPSERGFVRNLSSGVFSDWVTPRIDINSPSYLGFLYQSPVIADNIFLTQASPLQDTDQFLVNAYFDVKAVEPVSVIGLPM